MLARKKPIPVRFRFAECDQEVATLEGPVRCKTGDAILTGVQGEQWPVSRTYFDAKYELDEPAGTCIKKPVLVSVRKMDQPFSVRVAWADALIHGKAGDWLVTNGPGDEGIVDADIFEKTYDIVEPIA